MNMLKYLKNFLIKLQIYIFYYLVLSIITILIIIFFKYIVLTIIQWIIIMFFLIKSLTLNILFFLYLLIISIKNFILLEYYNLVIILTTESISNMLKYIIFYIKFDLLLYCENLINFFKIIYYKISYYFFINDYEESDFFTNLKRIYIDQTPLNVNAAIYVLLDQTEDTEGYLTNFETENLETFDLMCYSLFLGLHDYELQQTVDFLVIFEDEDVENSDEEIFNSIIVQYFNFLDFDSIFYIFMIVFVVVSCILTVYPLFYVHDDFLVTVYNKYEIDKLIENYYNNLKYYFNNILKYNNKIIIKNENTNKFTLLL